MRTHQTQSHGAVCLLLALSLQACFSESADGARGNAVALERSALQARAETQPAAAKPQATPVDSPPPTEEEKRARMEIAREDVAELSEERQREYRRAEKAALRAVLPVKRAALAQAQANRPTEQSTERDALDAEIARLKDNIDKQSKKLQDLEAIPD